MPNWQCLLVAPTDGVETADKLQRMLEDVQYRTEAVTNTAAKSLKDLLLSHGVESQLADALVAVRTAAQLHAALRQITSRVAVGLRQQRLAPLQDWMNRCMQLAPSVLSTTHFLEEVRAFLKEASLDPDGFEVAFAILVDKNVLLSKKLLQEVDNLPSMRNAIRAMVVEANNKAHLCALMASLRSALGTGSTPKSANYSFDWFVNTPQKGAARMSESRRSTGTSSQGSTMTPNKEFAASEYTVPPVDEEFRVAPHISQFTTQSSSGFAI